MTCTFQYAYQLMMEGSQALAVVENNGMRLDMAYIDRMIDETGFKVKSMTEELESDEVWRKWKKIYGSNANLESGDQLGHIIFDVMGVDCTHRTATGKPATDEDTLEAVDFPFVKKLMNIKKLTRARNTNLIGLKREQVGGILRPNFNLHIAGTYRSSASDPNSQNWPIRDNRLARLVRTAFIPFSDEFTLLEVDMSGAEVRVATCYHKDPTMVRYIQENHDLHKDMAMECYMLKKDQVTKPVRGIAKGGFVFAAFYGDWFIQIATNLWTAIDRDDLKTVDGVCLKEHLAKKGINELGEPKKDPERGTFMHHVKSVFENFWNNRFPVYTKWKEEWWNDYLDKGWFQTLTGFICRGIYERNKAINYPIQGSSFHCLLWSLIQINKWLIKNKMKSRIIGQIHDSIIFDIYKKEFDYVFEKICRVMLREIREAWDWITVPLEIEAEGSDVNWYQKSKIQVVA